MLKILNFVWAEFSYFNILNPFEASGKSQIRMSISQRKNDALDIAN